MDIIIRKIHRKGRSLVFKPNSKSGYKFELENAQPCLTAFQKSCVQTKPQKDRRLGSFWTPNFCYIGSVIVKDGEVSLLDMISISNESPMTDFNNYFPSKKHYWYDKAKPQNPAMETYFIGVRAVASLLAHYYKLQKLGSIKEAALLYKKYLTPLGLARLLQDVDSSLLGDGDFLYPISLSNKDCVMKAHRDQPMSINDKVLVDQINSSSSSDFSLKEKHKRRKPKGDEVNGLQDLDEIKNFTAPEIKKGVDPMNGFSGEWDANNDKEGKKTPFKLPNIMGDK